MKNIHLVLAATMLSVILLVSACSSDDAPTNNNSSVASCEGCHTNKDNLKKVFTPDTAAGGSSCGGETPHYEPYERVVLEGSGWEDFKKSSHYSIGCVGCHNGTDKTDDKAKAHSGDFVAHPTAKLAGEKCAKCHADDVAAHNNSLHQQGWGQKRKVTIRYGLAGAKEFDLLPASVKAGYETNCAQCHASTCGDCHVNRPKAQGGGLMSGHKFAKKPDMLNTCVGCHTSRGGHAFLGVASGTQPDVHKTKLNFECTSCHSKEEIHGTGEFVETRFHYSELPKCEDCHKGLENKNTYHSLHYSSFSCQTCHSQNYNNCGSCHIHGDGARILSYQDFKIGINPIPNQRSGKFAVLRRTLSAPDSWEKYGVAKLENFDAFPAYNYSTPHNIQRWTQRTQVAAGKSCFDNCHVVKDGETIKNKELYLFKSDLKYDWEKSSSEGVTVDGKLPSSWPQ